MGVVENKLKVGQQFEVVEVLTDGGYSSGLLKSGGHTIMSDNNLVLTNGEEPDLISTEYFGHAAHMYDTNVKKIGRLTVKEVKS